jgi:hypothetical protein
VIGLVKFSERLNFGRPQVLIWAGRGRPAMYTSDLSPGVGRGSFGPGAFLVTWPLSGIAAGKRERGSGELVHRGCRPSPSLGPTRLHVSGAGGVQRPELFAGFRPHPRRKAGSWRCS